jgi:hypothetical protein
MILVAIYKIVWLLLGAITSGVWPRSVFDVANLLEGPAYLISAATAWKWPWVAESVSLLTLVVIFARFNPWTINPFQRGLSVDYAFIAAANVVFFTRMAMRRIEKRSN